MIKENQNETYELIQKILEEMEFAMLTPNQKIKRLVKEIKKLNE
jgi:hypothetical protein